MAESFDPYQQWLGIAPHERPINHYRLLGIETFESDPTVIAAAADRGMQKLRRHQTGPRGAATQQLLNEISSAKVCLLNPAARSAYDEMLRGLAAAGDEPAVLPPARLPTVQVKARQPRRPRAVPYYRQPWFPAAAVAATLALAAVVWLAGQTHLVTAPKTTSTETHSHPPAIPPTDPRQPSSGPTAARWVVVQQEAAGDINLSPGVARLSGRELRLEFIDSDEVLTGWKAEDDQARWRFVVRKLPPQGVFRATVTYGGDRGSTYELTVDGERITGYTRAREEFVEDEHFVAISTAGQHELALRAAAAENLRLKWIELSFVD